MNRHHSRSRAQWNRPVGLSGRDESERIHHWGAILEPAAAREAGGQILLAASGPSLRSIGSGCKLFDLGMSQYSTSYV